VAWFSDRLQKRGIFLVMAAIVTAVGYIILLAAANAHKPGILYFATYLVATGLYIGPGLNITYYFRRSYLIADGWVQMLLHITRDPRRSDSNRLSPIPLALLQGKYTPLPERQSIS
jgi:hypothetical protein